MEILTAAKSLLPENLANALEQRPDTEEVRLRLGKSPGVIIAGREYRLSSEQVEQSLLLRVLEKATGASLHAAAPALSGGFITYHGLRIGVCGEAVYTGSDMKGLRSFSSLAIRIPHAIPAECGTLIDSLIRPAPVNTLIVAAPGVGKTSFLRELIRRTANQALRVSVIDERNELSASFSGHSQFDLGHGSDVLIGVPKGRAAMMMLRGMNPQVIAMDEITQEEDICAVEQITGCGVILYATAHGRNPEDMKRRPIYKKLLDSGVFRELVLIRCIGGKRLYSREALT